MTENNVPKKPETLSELFSTAAENLKSRGVETQPPSSSNLQASSQLNRELLDSVFIKPEFLNPVQPDISTTLFGVRMEVPVFCPALSKPGYQSDEEMIELVKGMGKAGSLMMLGIGGSDLLKSAVETGTPIIKIVKPFRDIDLVYKKIEEIERLGCIATGMDIDHFYGIFRDGRSMMSETFSPKTMEEMRKVVASTKLPFIIKGVLSVADAERAVELGASAIIVSNHAGASFDFGIPSVMALPEIVAAVGNWVTVLVDSGFRTGNDVFKGLALGAKGVGFGTSILAASFTGGAEGVERFIGFIASELKRTMALSGCSALSAIDSSLLTVSPALHRWFA